MALLLTVLGSWIYFAVQSMRIPLLKNRIVQLEAEAQRIDTLQARLQELQDQYDQVYRMLGAPVDTTNQVGTKGIKRP